MKIDIHKLYRWENDDGEECINDAEELNDMFGGKEWPETTPVYRIVVPRHTYIGEFTQVDVADMIAAFLRTKGGHAKLEALLAVRELAK